MNIYKYQSFWSPCNFLKWLGRSGRSYGNRALEGCLSFSPWWPLAFPLFLTAVINLNVFLSTKLVSFVFCSHSSSFSIIHDNVDIKIKSKERISFVVVVFIAKSPRSYAIYRRKVSKRASAWNAKFHPGLHEGWTYVGTYALRSIFSEPKFLGCIDYQIFLPMLLLYAPFAHARVPLLKQPKRG